VQSLTDRPQPRIRYERVSDALAIVTLQGEHDIATAPDVRRALRRAGVGVHVVIDLSRCVFVDSTVITVFLAAHAELVAAGARLALVVPPVARGVSRVVGLTHLDLVMPVYPSREVASAALAGTA
jgi:anti-anti-sigma factor